MADIQIDTDARLAAVSRSVEDADREGPYKAVIVSERYPSPPADVWDALTDPERLSRWFLPVTGELRLGGHYQLEGNAGGEVLECEPEERFVVTWVYDDNVSWVEVTLTAEGDGTRMRLVHTCQAANPFWDQFGPGATGVGWESGMLGLAVHLASGDAVDRGAVEAWTMSPEGLRLMRESAAGWGEADAAGGEDPDVARRRAEETATFYTTIPEPAEDDEAPGEPAG